MSGRCPGDGGKARWVHQTSTPDAGLTGLAAVRDVGLDGLVLVEVGHRPVRPRRMLAALKQDYL